MTELQKRFCEEYVKDYVGVRAYMRANPGIEYESALRYASDLLKKDAVIDYIKLLQKEAVRSYGDMAELIAKTLAENAFVPTEDGKHQDGWQKSVEMLQKQWGLQQTKVDMKANTDIDIVIKDDLADA